MKPSVIFHIDEMQKWKLLLHNVKNLLAAYDNTDDVKVEVLANGEAVKGYLPNDELDLFGKMDALQQAGVEFSACNNALTGFQIPKEQLFTFVQVVPAGVRELTDRQMAGYAYIKP